MFAISSKPMHCLCAALKTEIFLVLFYKNYKVLKIQFLNIIVTNKQQGKSNFLTAFGCCIPTQKQMLGMLQYTSWENKEIKPRRQSCYSMVPTQIFTAHPCSFIIRKPQFSTEKWCFCCLHRDKSLYSKVLR